MSADISSISEARAQQAEVQDGESGAAGVPAKARSVHARLYPDAEEAEFGAAQSGAGAADQRHRGHDLHSWRGPQPARALAGADSRWPRERSSGRALPRGARHARRGRRAGKKTGSLEVRSETTEGVTGQ